ncbi:MAG TPA: CsbD family protein [Mycobacteriales bacterium]
MAAGDRIRGRTRAMTGRAKQRLGEATGDPRLAREGHAQQRRGNLRLALEKIKDAFRR